MGKVYVLELGSYSDKFILGIASTREKAEKILDLTKNYIGDNGRPVLEVELQSAKITEYLLDEIPSFLERRTYEITYFPGRGIKDQWVELIIDAKKTIGLVEEYEDYHDDPYYQVCVFADDKESAYKIANEKISKYIALKTCGEYCV